MSATCCDADAETDDDVDTAADVVADCDADAVIVVDSSDTVEPDAETEDTLPTATDSDVPPVVVIEFVVAPDSPSLLYAVTA